MALSDKHPAFALRLPEWIQMADTYEGERAVKRKRLDYLPATEGMVQDGMTTPNSPGWKDYDAYLMRAHYHDVVKDAVKAMIGILHNKPAEILLPKRMQPLLKKATLQNEGLQMLLRRINAAQLLNSRCGLLVDVPSGTDIDQTLPYLAYYDAPRIINWDAGVLDEGRNDLDLVVLDEGGQRRVGLTWKQETKYRVLMRGAGTLDGSGGAGSPGYEGPRPDEPYGVCVRVNNSSDPTPEEFIFPEIGGTRPNEIPFTFIGADDLLPDPEAPPLLGLSNLALAIYRAEADYRQTLYMQGQNTLVIIGGNVDDAAPGTLRIGAKGMIDLRLGGDAKYIGVSAAGLGEMRQSLTNDKMRAAQEGVAFLDVAQDGASSGEALRVRVAARTTTLASVAETGAKGLEQSLQQMARWLGEDPEEVKVKAVTDFADQTVAGAALLAFMQAKQLGLPLSLQSMHRMMKLNDMTEMSFDEENEQIEDEAESMLGAMVAPIDPSQQDANGFLDDEGNEPGSADPEPPKPGNPPAAPASTAPPNKNVPVKPHGRAKGHTRGSPVPLKRKVGKKGASAGK